MTRLAGAIDGVIGVDPHRDILAAATDVVGGLFAQTSVSADAAGYRRLFDFARAPVPGWRCWAVEGAGSYGAGLAAFLQVHGERVVEVGRPKRPTRRSGAKSDALDAVRAAREALAHAHPLAPRRRGDREAPRLLLATAAAPAGRKSAPSTSSRRSLSGRPRSSAPSCAGWRPSSRFAAAPRYGTGQRGRWSTA
jgi:transposase